MQVSCFPQQPTFSKPIAQSTRAFFIEYLAHSSFKDFAPDNCFYWGINYEFQSCKYSVPKIRVFRCWTCFLCLCHKWRVRRMIQQQQQQGCDMLLISLLPKVCRCRSFKLQHNLCLVGESIWHIQALYCTPGSIKYDTVWKQTGYVSASQMLKCLLHTEFTSAKTLAAKLK